MATSAWPPPWLAALEARAPDAPQPAGEPEPDPEREYALIWRDWLRDLAASGDVTRLSGTRAAAIAAALLARAEADLLGASEAMRLLVINTMRLAWAERGFTAPEGPNGA